MVHILKTSLKIKDNVVCLHQSLPRKKWSWTEKEKKKITAEKILQTTNGDVLATPCTSNVGEKDII